MDEDILMELSVIEGSMLSPGEQSEPVMQGSILDDPNVSFDVVVGPDDENSIVEHRDDPIAPNMASTPHKVTTKIVKGKLRRCTWCTWTSSSSSSLTRHRRRVHNRKVHCAQCPASFTCKFDLKEHIRGHHEGGMLCEYCSKRYTSRSGLKLHVRSAHTQQKKYECQICHKRFNQKTHFVGHMNAHAKSRPYRCQ